MGEHFGRRIIQHGGGIFGFSSKIVRYPDDGLLVVVLSNLDSAPTGRISRNLAAMVLQEAILEERPQVAVDTALLEDYLGRYQLRPDFVITVTLEGDQLFVQATDQPRFPVYAASETTFFLTVVEAEITFVRGDDGEVDHIVLRQGGRERKAERIE